MSATAADLHSYRVVGFWQSTNGKESRSAMVNPDCGLKTRGWAEVRLALGRCGRYAAILAHPSRLDGERTALSISDLTGCLSNSWQRHSALWLQAREVPI